MTLIVVAWLSGFAVGVGVLALLMFVVGSMREQ